MEMGLGYKVLVAIALAAALYQVGLYLREALQRAKNERLNRAIGAFHKALNRVGVEVVGMRIDYHSRDVQFLLLIRGEPDKLASVQVTIYPGADDGQALRTAEVVRTSMLELKKDETRKFTSFDGHYEVEL